MKLSKLVLAFVAIALFATLTVSAKNEMRKAYMYGIAASFNDSTVYMTHIQEVDSCWFTSKYHFLVGRENYSYQLRDFLENHGDYNRTCSVVFGFDKKKVEKKWNKLYAKYTAKQKITKKNTKHENERPPFNAAFINDFSFEPVAPTEEAEEVKLTKEEKKEAKQKIKEAKKKAKLEKKQKKNTQKGKEIKAEGNQQQK